MLFIVSNNLLFPKEETVKILDRKKNTSLIISDNFGFLSIYRTLNTISRRVLAVCTLGSPNRLPTTLMTTHWASISMTGTAHNFFKLFKIPQLYFIQMLHCPFIFG